MSHQLHRRRFVIGTKVSDLLATSSPGCGGRCPPTTLEEARSGGAQTHDFPLVPISLSHTTLVLITKLGHLFSPDTTARGRIEGAILANLLCSLPRNANGSPVLGEASTPPVNREDMFSLAVYLSLLGPSRSTWIHCCSKGVNTEVTVNRRICSIFPSK